MARKVWITIVVGMLIVSGGRTIGAGDATGAQDGGFHCSDLTLKGTFGAQMQGTRPAHPPATGIETVIGVVIRTYDGYGNFTQFDNIKGSLSGIVPDRPGQGTYHVNSDCTAVTQFVPAPGVLIEEKMVIVDHGNEVRSIVTSPQPVMVSSTQLRIDHR